MTAGGVLELAKLMAKKERSYAKELSDLADEINHPVLKALIAGIASDSEKHSRFYEAVIALLSSKYPLLSQEKLDLIRDAVRRHIEVEAEMIKLTKEWAEKTDDSRLKLILMAIHDDEVKHHSLLVSIERHIARAETLTEQDLWDMIWKDSLWHGAPGG